MAGMTTRHATRLSVLACALGSAACAAALNEEFGDQGLQHQRFVELDSTLGMHLGSDVLIRAQRDLGQDRPGPSRPNVVSFHGRLLGLDAGWVHVGVGDIDSLRIGKGSIVGVWLAEEARTTSRLPGAFFGALIGAATAFGIMQAQDPVDRPNNETQVVLIGGAGLTGGLVGALVSSPDRRGPQLYPAPPPARDTTSGRR